MPAAIAIPLIIGAASAGATVYAANKSAGAAKDAASMQQDSVTRAQNFNQQAFDKQQQALAPYQQAGQFSLANLMAHYGDRTPALQAQRTNAYVNAAQQRNPSQGFPLAQPQLADLVRQPATNSPYNPAALNPAMAQQTVRMVGPDGSIAQVPRQNVMEAIRRGAQMV